MLVICFKDLDNLMLFSLLLPNVPGSIVVIPSGSVMLVRPVLWKLAIPMVVNAEGKDIAVSLEQAANASAPISVTL